MNDFELACQRLTEQLGRDVVISLATSRNDDVSVRAVDGYYRDCGVYVVTYEASRKMRDIAANPRVALCRSLLTASGIGENLGNPLKEENRELREELKQVFCAFYDRHVDEQDPRTCILRIALEQAVVFDDDSKYVVDFKTRTAVRTPFHNDIVNPDL